jgi:L-threonylcarbamoyladenylate synthase
MLITEQYSKGAIQRHLKQGGIIAYSTESCFGLGCDPSNIHALARLIRMKGRSPNMGLILIASQYQQLKPFIGKLNPAEINTAREKWPGPHSWIMPASQKCPGLLTGGRSTIACRVTAHLPAARLCDLIGQAIVSTSANFSGRPALKTAQQVSRCFGRRVMVIHGRIGTRKTPSRIQDIKTGTVIRA